MAASGLNSIITEVDVSCNYVHDIHREHRQHYADTSSAKLMCQQRQNVEVAQTTLPACMQRGAKNQHTPIRRYADRPPPAHRPLRSRIRRYADLFPDPLQAQNTPIRRRAAPTRRYADTPIHRPPTPQAQNTPIR